jgi:protein O-GlcNAc transferase
MLDPTPPSFLLCQFLFWFFMASSTGKLSKRKQRSTLTKASDLQAFNHLLSQGNFHAQQQEHSQALICFNQAIALQPKSAAAYFNQANSLKALQQFKEAVNSYDQAIALQPDYAQAYNNRGNALDSLLQPKQALASYDRALALLPDNALILSNRAATLRDLRRLDEALLCYEQAFSADPHQEFVLGNLLTVKMQLCDWQQLPEALQAYALLIRAGRPVALPFSALALLDDPLLHKQMASLYAQTKHPTKALAEPFQLQAAPSKIRIAYYSADFHNHATAYLIAELIEQHDRSRFEVIGFSFGPDLQDTMRQRLIAGFDAFHDVSGLSDEQVARQSRQLGIHIAIDLKGYTQHARPSIFAYRCAPVQVSYLGYPGTLGTSYMDYIIADKIVIPPERYADYSEKVVSLPHSYQVNDSKRAISSRVYSRSELGLPEQAFVFCCFNNNHKILPATFESWMRILSAVPGSVLWLFEENAIAAQNLRSAAKRCGVAPERLVFAPRMPLAEHLARHRAANLFLDTMPYNAHTTASDALWAGLPVLTCLGQTFAARVAASLLHALGLPQLITESQQAFEAKAIELATQPKLLQAIQNQLTAQRQAAPLFNTALFTQHIEQAYETMQAKQQAGLPPQSFDVD